ncbi:hypothetical protein G5V59_02445 [Nocardioides sp. W3-2-3]|uniref:hypothetical protein n=1 Tax=Nocardioides convexus TaxID=2712224 RepID=UPI0024187E9B|nr:hypothetical protein [Nocardioides convexus]NGZ99612.1 hypothetical protein [Nocardioides convexus]
MPYPAYEGILFYFSITIGAPWRQEFRVLDRAAPSGQAHRRRGLGRLRRQDGPHHRRRRDGRDPDQRRRRQRHHPSRHHRPRPRRHRVRVCRPRSPSGSRPPRRTAGLRRSRSSARSSP